MARHRGVRKSVVPNPRKSEESASRHIRGSPSGPSEYEEPMGSDARMRNPKVQATTTSTHSRLRNKKSVVPDPRKSEESASRHLRGSPSGSSE